MTTECNGKLFEFHPLGAREVRGGFDGGAITSDGGGLLLREVEKRTRIVERFAACFTDYRDADRVERTVRELAGWRRRCFLTSAICRRHVSPRVMRRCPGHFPGPSGKPQTPDYGVCASPPRLGSFSPTTGTDFQRIRRHERRRTKRTLRRAGADVVF